MSAMDVVDVEGVIMDYMWKMYDMTKSKDQGKIPREHLDLKLNWRRVKFVHDEPEYVEVDRPPVPKCQVLFCTYFTNNTDREQEYSFKTERTTTSSCELNIEKGYTLGYEMNVTLKTPCEVFEANAGFSRELSVTNATGQTYEEELNWGVDSQIKVKPHTKTTAKLQISEDQYAGKFKMCSHFSGKVLGSITNMRDNNSFVKSIEGNVGEIMKREIQNGLKGFVVDKGVVSFETKGTCNFHFAIEQHVHLSEESINS